VELHFSGTVTECVGGWRDIVRVSAGSQARLPEIAF
jgi:hypothetical protein